MNVLYVQLLLRFYFYNPLIINGVFVSIRVGVFCRIGAVICVRTSVLLAIFNKKSLHSMKGVPQFLIPQSENDKLLFRRYIIYIYFK